ncbi:MAG: methionyl-tRNA formyltransferase [Tissierellia bacterium]|nr:methionyl-tRNA formyltransferase [Tissierellia bacterium]
MRVVFMSTPDFGVKALEAIAKAHQVVGVITQQDKPRGRGKKMMPTPIKESALSLGITVYQPKNVNDKESYELIKSLNPEVIVVVAYGQIVKRDLLDLPKYGCINIHASLLPKYRGAAPMVRALMDGEKETGITIMKMEEGLDTGPMAMMKSTSTDGKNAGLIHDELAIMGAELIVKTLEQLERNEIIWEKQDDGKASYAHKISKEDGQVHFNNAAEEVYHHIMAFDPYPGAFTTLDGLTLKLFEPEIVSCSAEEKPGTILSAEGQLIISCGTGCIKVGALQKQGKKRMEIKEFLRGNRLLEGTVLGG